VKVIKGPRGERYRLAVFRIEEHDAQGRPSKVSVVYDEQTVDLTDGGSVSFMTGYLPEHMTKPKARS
jgi:hypothetical protein